MDSFVDGLGHAPRGRLAVLRVVSGPAARGGAGALRRGGVGCSVRNGGHRRIPAAEASQWSQKALGARASLLGKHPATRSVLLPVRPLHFGFRHRGSIGLFYPALMAPMLILAVSI